MFKNIYKKFYFWWIGYCEKHDEFVCNICYKELKKKRIKKIERLKNAN